MKNKTDEMANMPIKALVLKYSIPTIIAMLVNSIYNMVDRIFVGQFVGESALAGLAIAFPVMLMSMALASLFGGGAAPLIAIRLGEKNEEGAAKTFGNMIVVLFVIGGSISIFGSIFCESILSLLGAGPETMQYAHPYLQIIFVGLFFQLFSMTLANVVRTEGQIKLAMVSQIGSALINIVLDYLFVVVFRWGIVGAAYATISGQIFGALVLLSFYLRRKSILKLKRSSFIPDFRILKEKIFLGSSMFIGQFGAGAAMTFLNIFLLKYGGTPALTSVGAINSIYTLFIMPMFGVQMGIQPIVSFNHGAGNIKRKWDTLKFGISLITGFTIFVWILILVFPTGVLSLFLDRTSETMPVAVNGLRKFNILLPIVGIQMLGSGYFQATNHPKEALLLSSLRQFILLIPLLYIMSPLWGIDAVWLATPVADGIATIITGALLLKAFRGDDQNDALSTDLSAV